MNSGGTQASGVEAQDFFVQTLEQVIDVVVVIDDHNLVVFFNAAAEQFWGCLRNEAIGTDANSLIPKVLIKHHDDFVASNRQGGVNKIEDIHQDVRIVRKDGQERWALMSVSKIAMQGRTLYAVVLKDVTQTRAQDIEYRLLSMLISTVSSAVCIVNSQAILIYVNETVQQATIGQ
jgi:PAS domain S-box-containing protein